MQKTLSMFLALALLTGCTLMRGSGGASGAGKNGGDDSFSVTKPPYVLPGVPLGSARPVITARVPAEAPEAGADARPAEAAPTPAELAEVQPAAPAAAPAAPAVADLDFHMAAGDKYSAKKKYRSAAAEYGAALGYLPAEDARAVHLLERQGAMLLKAGAEPKAREYFRSAIKKAAELNVAGDYLADAHLGLGYCLEKDKKLPEAISSYEKARELTSSKAVKARLSRTISDLKK